MVRAFQVRLDNMGTGTVEVGPSIVNKEWDIYQITVQTATYNPDVRASIFHNGFLLTSTPFGYTDSAAGPPDTVVGPNDRLTVQWDYGTPMDLATVSIWYNENDVGGTVSLAH